ncbi:hypothetical protein BH11PSE8_BH11PSE8_45190 [soil metagenome]
MSQRLAQPGVALGVMLETRPEVMPTVFATRIRTGFAAIRITRAHAASFAPPTTGARYAPMHVRSLLIA